MRNRTITGLVASALTLSMAVAPSVGFSQPRGHERVEVDVHHGRTEVKVEEQEWRRHPPPAHWKVVVPEHWRGRAPWEEVRFHETILTEPQRHRINEWVVLREDRRRIDLEELHHRYDRWLYRDDVREIVRVHYDRIARINRVRVLAVSMNQPETISRCDELIVRENNRWTGKMNVTVGI